MKFTLAAACLASAVTAFSPSSFVRTTPVAHRATSSSSTCLEMKYKVAVVGGGPSGACAAEIFAQEKGIDTVLFERKLDNAKPCGGAIPLCMVGEFDLPESVVDRKVRKMNLISPTGVEVNIGETLQPDEYIGMCRREILDKYIRDRAFEYGAECVNGLVTSIDVPEGHKSSEEPYTLHYQEFVEGSAAGVAKTMDVDLIVGADGANSRVAKAMDAGLYNFAIAFQERIKISEEKMEFYEEMAEMYVGDDVSPDFYGWVFPKYDHVGVGTGTVVNRPAIKQYQKAIRDRAGDKIAGGKIIKVEAHPIPEHYRPRRVQGRIALVGDAAGYVTKCSGEGIYFAAKSGRMAAEEIVKLMKGGSRLPTQAEIEDTYLAKYDKLYGPTYAVLDILQKVFYSNNGAREAFVELCNSKYVQQVTFDSYLYKKVQGNNPLDDIKLLGETIGCLIKGYANAKPDAEFSNPIESQKRLG
uniref:Geranylgeranyl diphosphate reductase, chloroplastic n=1 Tax=Helicotheca tamesis TaxID=374047 RepID=A0A7S2N464_9STRA|eukprot:CAMPEP_0185723084 /NCGR_PEP_ID=MMETSP1171-20130828/29_1 /TAXON_ID=374046 /ORGANISM="Helicotheca tamensis, Strain CCMP826" /LENGTH=468 /DNA_ID=CAMNT_0028390747 /DNA_START=54 /DNA_END=1460 /DNA_ORIENTATION=+